MNLISITNAVEIKNNRVKPFDGEKDYLATGGLVDNSISTEKVDYKTKPSRADLLVDVDQLVVARMKSTTKVLLVDNNTKDLIVSTGFLVLTPKDGWDPKFLYHYFKSSNFQDQKDKLSIGATQQAINNSKFKDILIPELSFEDQKRIVKILDEADALRQKRKQAIGLLDEYLKSVFLEMFGDPVKNPKGLRVERLETLTNKITDGTHKTPNYLTEGVKFISAKNIKEEQITWEDIRHISEVEHKAIYKRCNPERNDLLLTKSGSLGMVALVDVDFEFSLFESLALIKIKRELINPIYLREYLNLKEIKSFYSERTKGVGVKHLHLVDIKSIPILVPDKKDQKIFTEEVKKIKSLKQNMINQFEKLEAQFLVLIQKAFKGEL